MRNLSQKNHRNRPAAPAASMVFDNNRKAANRTVGDRIAEDAS
jgi:hypothetical protein